MGPLVSLITRKEAARRLGVSERTIDRLRQRDPDFSRAIVKVGRSIMMNKEALEAWIERGGSA